MTFHSPIPILRMFSLDKAREFYLDYLGFAVDWEHTFEPNTPVYMQIRRGSAVFHLSEHVGDGTPGTAVFISMIGVEEYLEELQAKNYKYYRPAIEARDWGKEMGLIDPFGNRLRFVELASKQ